MNVYVLETAKRLAERGAQVDVFTRRHDPDDPQCIELGPGARLIHLDAGPVEASKHETYPFLPLFTERLLEFLRREGSRYDIIISHYWLSGLVGLRLRRILGIPHVTSFHTLAELKRRARPGEWDLPVRADSEARIAAGADRVVVWTEHERDAAARYYHTDPARIEIIPPGVDTDRFRPSGQSAARKRLGMREEKTVLYVGRLERLKGVDILLEASAALSRTMGIRLLIAGGYANSPELARLQSLASELGAASFTTFLGSMSRDRLPDYYNAADVCVLPSYYESFGLAALEASACGTPVVASKVGGLPCVVKDGETGFLIPWRCPGPFVDSVEKLLTDDGLRGAMGMAARAHAETLTWDATVDKLMDVFDAVGMRAALAGSLAAG